jgi:hypothetical protein
MQAFLSYEVPASSSCFIWLRSLTSAIQCFLAEFISKKSCHMPVSQELIFCCTVVEKKEGGRASEFADQYTKPATSEFYRKFLMIMICVREQSGP